MALLKRPRRLLVSSSLLVLFSIVSVRACSDDWSPDVFIRRHRPDVPKDFYSGRLGILEGTYYRVNLIAAYRYLNGGGLAASEAIPRNLIEIGPYYEETRAEETAEADSNRDIAHTGVAGWVVARNAVAKTKLPNDAQYSLNGSRSVPGSTQDQYAFFENCPENAFDAATATLQARTKAWSVGSEALEKWIANQDAVFQNCDGKTGVHLPAPALASAPALLKQDTTYQIAAAQFYAVQFPEATAAFKTISQDQASPWHGIAAYLVARTTVRRAMLVPPAKDYGAPSTFDRALLETAKQQLEALKGNSAVPASATQKMLQFVNAKLDPMARIREASNALAGPQPDSDFERDLIDLVYLLNQRLDGAIDEYQDKAADDKTTADTNAGAMQRDLPEWKKTADLRAASTMVDWLVTFQTTSEAARQHALQQWKTTKSLPWLVAAIAKTQPNDPSAAALMDAAAKVPKDSPAWQSVTYHRARLMTPSHADDARTLLNTTLPVVKVSGPISAVNAFTGLRMSVATTFEDYLKYAPRMDLYAEAGPARSLEFAEDSAGFFNAQAPLSIWLRAAKADQLPQSMRQSLILNGWTRSVILNDPAATASFAAMLPVDVHKSAGDAADFPAWLTILRNGGLTYLLTAGTQRSDTYNKGADWWCSLSNGPTDIPLSTSTVSFMTPAEAAAGKAEFATIKSVSNAPIWLGQRVIAYAKDHPDDKDVPEALHLTVRATRYGCRYGANGSETATSAVSAEAFRLLHKTYPQSPWTKKTPYHF